MCRHRIPVCLPPEVGEASDYSPGQSHKPLLMPSPLSPLAFRSEVIDSHPLETAETGCDGRNRRHSVAKNGPLGIAHRVRRTPPPPQRPEPQAAHQNQRTPHQQCQHQQNRNDSVHGTSASGAPGQAHLQEALWHTLQRERQLRSNSRSTFCSSHKSSSQQLYRQSHASRKNNW
jgi:hypothetical protein